MPLSLLYAAVVGIFSPPVGKYFYVPAIFYLSLIECAQTLSLCAHSLLLPHFLDVALLTLIAVIFTSHSLVIAQLCDLSLSPHSLVITLLSLVVVVSLHCHHTCLSIVLMVTHYCHLSLRHSPLSLLSQYGWVFI